MRVLVFGASTTQGYWDTEGGWVARLRRYYDEHQVKAQAAGTKNEGLPVIFNLGISADTTKDVLKRFYGETEARLRPNSTFIFSIGANNSAVEEGKNRDTPEEYRMDIEALIKKAQKYSNKIMFVGLNPCDEARTTPVFWGNIHYTNERMAKFDQVLQDVCTENKITYVSLREAFEKQMAKGKNLFVDGLHPNNEGHELIFQLVRPELDKLLAG